MNTQTIRLSSPVDLITSLPYQFGFHPKRSVVLVCLYGGRLGLCERLDIPPLEHVQDAVAAMIGPMLKERPSDVVLLGYEDVEDEAAPLLDALKVAIGWYDGIELADVLVIRDGRWYSRECENPTCCPTQGTPLAESVSVASEFVALGHNPSNSREDVAARLEARSGAIGAVNPAGIDQIDALAAWAKVLTTGELSRQETEDAALALLDIDFRDAMVAHTCPGVLPWDLVSDELKAVFETMPKVVHEGALDRLVDLCSSLTDVWAAPALTILANYAWFIGDGGMARLALDRALRCDPRYRLALLLDRMVQLAIRPSSPVA
jgi:hypothetical protein